MTTKCFISGRRLAAGIFASFFFVVVAGSLASSDKWNPLLALGSSLIFIALIGWRVLPRTVVDEFGLAIYSGWGRARRIRWSDIRSVDIAGRRLWVEHSDTKSKIEGLDDGVTFAYRVPNRLREAQAYISERRLDALRENPVEPRGVIPS